MVVENEEKKSNDIIHDSFALKVCLGCLQIALKQVKQDSQQVVVVFSILELLDNLSNQNYDELTDSI